MGFDHSVAIVQCLLPPVGQRPVALARECVMNPAQAEASNAQGDGDDAQRHQGRERHDEELALLASTQLVIITV
eukprot:CAMPEP_0118817086 /NCGR_PEP_ID=MMETSP1162-20130426/5180_1 /TAXON_ID=33656 /ORGANISM="Phaeocystis Sp, Strain CCMP2710" /LENGTH=73 /DNA_ID=CAMNT_0006747157 /DNA_START=154 /DNA_END=372 /DNA_ORIENTATION=-